MDGFCLNFFVMFGLAQGRGFVFDLPDHAIFLQTYACGMAKICGHGEALCITEPWGGLYKGLDLFLTCMFVSPASSLPHSLDDGLAICAGVRVGGRP